MDKPVNKLARCAIYTRKSTEHNLDLEFNSLDAQREACEAYIKSQAHEGWRLVPDRFDDGAFSGASLERPALQSLLSEVRSKKIDIIVVYKVDRLTRSLADFAKLVELFDQHAVSFVSVTQSFNTTTSMGRLTLNVLLSFAQFEREVIGERVRDKIAASKRKGMWVGGPVPLGYKSVDKKLVVVPDNAERVRLMFSRYLELGSLGALAQDLQDRGIQTVRRKCDQGEAGAAVPFSVGALAHLLKNRFYVGDVVYRGKVARGDHPAIIDRELFEAVQARLAATAAGRRLHLRGSPAILAGRLFDDRGNRMTPTHSNKRGARYQYYVSHALLQGRRAGAGGVLRVAAPDLESLVLAAVREHWEARFADLPAPEDGRDLIECSVQRIVLHPDAVRIRMARGPTTGRSENDQGSTPAAAGALAADIPAATTEANATPSDLLTIPWSRQITIAHKGVLHQPSKASSVKPEVRQALLLAIARARGWIDDLLQGRAASLADIAAREGKGERYIRTLTTLAFLSPRAIAAIADGNVPGSTTVTALAQALPHAWHEQESMIAASSN